MLSGNGAHSLHTDAETVEYPYRRLPQIGSVFPQVKQPSECRQAVRIEGEDCVCTSKSDSQVLFQ